MKRVEIEELICGTFYVDPKRALLKILNAGLTEQHFVDPALKSFFADCFTAHVQNDDKAMANIWHRHHETLIRISDKVTTLSIFSLAESLVKATALQTARNVLSSMTASSHRQDEIDVIAREVSEAHKTIEQISSDIIDFAIPTRTVMERIIDSAMEEDATKKLVRQTETFKVGLNSVDRYLGGLTTSRYNIIAARPGIGKTTLATTMMARLCVNKVPCLFLSKEMSNEELALKMVSSLAQIPLSALDDLQTLSEDEMDRFMQAARIVSDAPCWLDQKSMPYMDRVATTIRRRAMRDGVKVFFIDYVQIMKLGKNATTTKRAPMFERLEEISGDIQSLAKDLNVCIVALVQMNRESEAATATKMPTAAHLKGSGSLEQDADGILILHEVPKKEGRDSVNDAVDHWLITAKNRFGPRAQKRLNFNRETCTFTDNNFVS